MVFLVEERSMKTLLEGLLPRILPKDILFQIIPHEGKADLERSVPIKIKAWTEPEVKFVIIQDQDSNDCKDLKQKLVSLAAPYGKQFLVRIACHELEAWYFGDMDALEKTYDVDLSPIRNKKMYRDPDAIVSPKSELRKIIPEHKQIEGARKMAPKMDISGNRSHSFNVFVSGVRRLCEGEAERDNK